MGNHADPKKKAVQTPPVQAKEAEGKSMAPPAFSLESSPVQMKGGLWDTFTDGLAWVGDKIADVANYFSPEEETKTETAKTEAAPLEVKPETPAAEVKEVKPEEKKPAAEVKADAKKDDKGLTDYKLEKKDAVMPKTGETHTGGDLTTIMLEKAGYDPASKWWTEFTDITLFGLSAKALHSDFANLLKNAEAKTVEKITASKDYQDWVTATKAKDSGTAKSVGKFMGLKGGYSTLRGEEPDSASMHAFGLAIDFNVTENPWISDSSGNLDKKDPKDKTKTVRDKTGVLKDALDRAGGLMGETLAFTHVNPDHFNYDMAATYDNMSKIDKGFERYFGMGKDDKDADLKAYLDKTQDPFWKGKTTAEARDLINNDLDVLSQWWDRKDKNKDQSEMIRTNGIMDLDRRMVTSMGEVGLDWGGKYGDMMHFDMRNTGVGIKIRKAKYDEDVKAKKIEIQKDMAEKKKAAAEAKKAEAAKKKADAAAAKKAAAEKK